MFNPLNFFYFLGYFVLLVITSCASEQPPEGGPKDEVPPKVVRTLPKDGGLNFKGKKISVTFDKHITVTDIYNKLLITPQLDKVDKKRPYKYVVNGKTLEIKFNLPLKEDTTYAMHFNDAVKDLHEGTHPVDSVLTFSTGSFIDPITAEGSVIELLTNSSMADVKVCLYSAERDPKEWMEQGLADYYARWKIYYKLHQAG